MNHAVATLIGFGKRYVQLAKVLIQAPSAELFLICRVGFGAITCLKPYVESLGILPCLVTEPDKLEAAPRELSGFLNVQSAHGEHAECGRALCREKERGNAIKMGVLS